jgi:hypothetical protein
MGCYGKALEDLQEAKVVEFVRVNNFLPLWAEDYELKFTWAMFNSRSFTSAPPCAGRQYSNLNQFCF